MSQNPSAFDTMGEFGRYHAGWNTYNSSSLPLDMGKSIPAKDRADAINAFNDYLKKPTAKPQEEQKGFWSRAFAGLEKAYNFTTQAVSFGLTLPEKNNPIWQGDFSLDNVKEAWDKSRDISAGRSIVRTVLGRPLDEIEGLFSGVVKTVSFGKLSGFDKFMQDHVLFAANDFDIFNKKQAEKAFREQNLGRFTSFGTDVVSRFVLDPTIFAGKAVKAYRASQIAVKGVKDLDAILTGQKVGGKAEKVKATFNDFITKTDDMNQTELFRVKAIRESSNPAAFADVMATANKIEDVAIRHQVKADIIKTAMGDMGAATRLQSQANDVAVKIGLLQDEVSGAKYLGAGVDKETGQATFDLLNNGVDYEKSLENVKLLETELADIHKKLSVESILDPNVVPKFDNIISTARITGQNKFIDIKNGYAQKGVRVLTGFMYKRPRGWIDFTDNQSAQTVDNLLNRVRGITSRQEAKYTSKINDLRNNLNTGKLKPEQVKLVKADIKKLEDKLSQATFSAQRKNELFELYTSAGDASARAVAFQKIEKELFDTVAKQFGYNVDEVNSAWRLFSGARARTHNLIRERAYTGAIDPKTGGPVGGKVKTITGSDDIDYVIPLPLNETQLVKQLPVIDIDSMYLALNRHSRARVMDKYGILGKVNRAGIASKRAATDLLDGLDSLIKFEVLARLGYPVRNVAEGVGRVITSVGAGAMVAGSTEKGIRMIQTRFKGASLEDVYSWSDEVKLTTHRMQLNALRNSVDDTDLIDQQIKEIDDMLEGKAKIVDKFGLGLRQVDGVTYEDALGASMAKANYVQERFIANAGKIVDDHLYNAKSKLSNAFETNGDFVIIKGTDENWAEAYLRVVNRQVRGSKITSILLQNKPREELIEEGTRFLTKTEEGRKIFRALGLGRDARSIVEANMDNIDNLFPEYLSRRKELIDIVSARNLDADDIKKFFGTDNSRYPDVNGAQVGAANGTNPVTKAYSYITNHFYKKFGEIPETYLVKHPMFVSLYRSRMDALVRNAIDTYPGDTIPPAYLQKLENSSRQWARAELRRTLYDTSERVDAAYTMRYMFPFFGAFTDVLEKWGRINMNDPSVLQKLQIVYNSPDRMGITEERDGKTYINVPGEWVKRGSLGTIDRPLSIPKASLDLLFQGNSWWNPGAGWFVQIGTSQLLKAIPDLERQRLVKEILPYGPEGTTARDIFLQSPALRKALAAFDENDPARKRLTVLIAMEENHKYDMGLRDTQPTSNEINGKAMKVLALEAAAKITLPFATNTRSPYQYYIDEYHRIRRDNPTDATDIFYQMYGDDYFIFTTSLSKNNTGIAATIEADKRSKELSDLIAKEPDYGWFIVGEVNAGEFSPSVYRKQFETPVAPGSTRTMRESQDPYVAVAETQAEQGWLEYNKGMDLIEAKRIDMGLPSLRARGAEALQQAKEEFIRDLSIKNPAWSEARGKIDTGKVTNFLKFAKTLTTDKRTKDRPDIVALREYLDGRQYVMGILANRDKKSINAEDNADIRYAWDTFIGELIDSNIYFNRLYTRMLENDDLTKGL